MIKTCYAIASSGGTPNAHDCEQTVYATTDLAGASKGATRIDKIILRSDPTDSASYTPATISLAYDLDGRVKQESGAVTECFAYNNFNGLTSHTNAVCAGSPTQTETYVYDTAGWLLSDTQGGRAVTYAYDSVGRRSQMTWPGSGNFFVSYTYKNDSSLSTIRDTGGAILVSFAYNNLGQRTSITRTGAHTSMYGYDSPRNRLNSLVNNASTLSGIVYTNTLTPAYSTSSQSDQLASLTQSNSRFDPTLPAAEATPYTINGLNQMTAAGTGACSYDTRGNMTNDCGSVTFTYNYNNLLTSTSNGGALTYDASNRLASYTPPGGSTTQFLYDGSDLIAEYDTSGTVLRRYVFGPGADEPLVWFEPNGSGTYDKRFFYADQQGSIVAVTNAGGAVKSIMSYDSYGQPATVSTATDSNMDPAYDSPFRYTGQYYLKGLNLYDYKVRLYSPILRRFLQTDPIGYGDGMNWYGYVHGDPINGSDPSGLGTHYCSADPFFNSNVPSDAGGPTGTSSGNFGYTTDGEANTFVSVMGQSQSPVCDNTTEPNDYGGVPYDQFNHDHAEFAGPGVTTTGVLTAVPDTPDQCPTGKYHQYSIDGSALGAVVFGVGLGVSLGISVSDDSILGSQVYASLSGRGTVGLGAGLFAGIGATRGHTTGPMQLGNFGLSPSLYGEGDLGNGEISFGGSTTISGNGSSLSVGPPIPHIGDGYGAYLGFGGQETVTLATKPFMCHS